jgi:hypothetical protein
LKKTTGDEDQASDKKAGSAAKDSFDQLFATNLDVADEADDTDDTYQPVPPKVQPPTFTTASGKVIEGLVDGGGDVTDALGNPVPVAFHIMWNGLEVARIFATGSVSASPSFDYSSIFPAEQPEDDKNLYGSALANERFAKLVGFFANQAG